jgi:hypothetical protein
MKLKTQCNQNLAPIIHKSQKVNQTQHAPAIPSPDSTIEEQTSTLHFSTTTMTPPQLPRNLTSQPSKPQPLQKPSQTHQPSPDKTKQ